MKHEDQVSLDMLGIADRLLHLPSKLIRYYQMSALAQMVLHYLGHNECFNFEKAAYLVDNPDFDHLVGAAGFHRHDCQYEHAHEIWDHIDDYQEHVKNSEFQKQVAKVASASLKRQNIDMHKSEDILKIAQDMGMKNPKFCQWNLKHGNHGLLIYETNGELDEQTRKLLERAVCFLGLCAHC